MLTTFTLFFITAVMEILGCYLPYLWLKEGHSPWLLIPAAGCLCAFVWLLTLHPQATGRIYAAYGGIYVCVALLWLWLVDATQPSWSDWVGIGFCVIGMLIIMFGQPIKTLTS